MNPGSTIASILGAAAAILLLFGLVKSCSGPPKVSPIQRVLVGESAQTAVNVTVPAAPGTNYAAKTSWFGQPLRLFVTDAEGRAISAYVHVRAETADLPLAGNDLLKGLAAKNRQTWPVWVDRNVLVPREGVTLRQDGHQIRVWVSQTPGYTPAGAKFVIWK